MCMHATKGFEQLIVDGPNVFHNQCFQEGLGGGSKDKITTSETPFSGGFLEQFSIIDTYE